MISRNDIPNLRPSALIGGFILMRNSSQLSPDLQFFYPMNSPASTADEIYDLVVLSLGFDWVAEAKYGDIHKHIIHGRTMPRKPKSIPYSEPLAHCLIKKKFKRGQRLFKDGDPAAEAYLIQKGYITVWRQEGKQRVILATRGEGEIVGEMALTDDTVRSANVTAETDVEAQIITRQQVKTMLAMSPLTLSLLLHQVLESLRTANDMIGMYAARLAEQKKEG
jgi:hypothetical protein